MSTDAGDLRLLKLAVKRKKKKNFSLVHKAERQCVLLPSLSLSSALTLLWNIKLFYSVCGGGLLAFPSTPFFFPPLEEKKKQWQCHRGNCSLSYWKAGTELYITVWGFVLVCFSSQTVHSSSVCLSSEILRLSFLIGTDFNRTNSNYWRDIAPFIERKFYLL